MLDKFKIGQRVRVVKRVNGWSYYGKHTPWDDKMDGLIGLEFTIIYISKVDDFGGCSGYRLNTQEKIEWDCWCPEESLKAEIVVGEQLQFDFMEE